LRKARKMEQTEVVKEVVENNEVVVVDNTSN
jgi:hypothetical protein